MGRKKLPMRRIENPTSRQATYAKRKDGIFKKANELSILCDTDVALIMFSPTGRLTSFSSTGRPINNEEDLEDKLDKLNRKQRESQDKLRYYEPNADKITSVLESGVYQHFLTSAIQRIQLSKAKLLGNQLVPETTENVEGNTTVQMEDTTSVTDQSIDRNKNGMDEDESGKSLSMGPHLSLSFIEAQRKLNNQLAASSDHSTSSFNNY
ncbi:PREDICTED: MADS-box transcription factor 23-like [Erythranthe guttata]|uniref:MADS-box transcription factor 23-like n=1 Tax=Erythranthe guttata TaxID=4155 RepID=UPI00064D7661|nr:PREDICTED: MADS-box transcription factor 23-like [Erythranthe guttata]|eukprot:XP_012837511.1 PREDICTED: MADS-box transcription factor 23-like [Erythranthe guttata]